LGEWRESGNNGFGKNKFHKVNFYLKKGEFAEEGTKTHFQIGNGNGAYILSESSGKRHIG